MTDTTEHWALKALNKQEMPYWWERMGERWVNRYGGSHRVSDRDVVYLEAHGDLDDILVRPDVLKAMRKLAERFLVVPNTQFGWVTPRGKFVSCTAKHHEDLAEFYFGVSTKVLEQTHAKVDSNILLWPHGKKIPSAMYKTLVALGWDDPDRDHFRDVLKTLER